MPGTELSHLGSGVERVDFNFFIFKMFYSEHILLWQLKRKGKEGKTTEKC